MAMVMVDAGVEVVGAIAENFGFEGLRGFGRW